MVAMRRTYARRSMMGAQFLLEMRARRSRRALSISAMYSASTTGADIAAENWLLRGSRGNEAAAAVGQETGQQL